MIDLRLRQLREEKQVNQLVVAQHLNITREAYSMYETGKRQMNYEALDFLAEYFNVSIDYLLGRKEDRGTFRPSEVTLIQKYALLDERGRLSVNAVLEHELSLVQKQENKRAAK